VSICSRDGIDPSVAVERHTVRGHQEFRLTNLTYCSQDTQYGVGNTPVDVDVPNGKVGETTQSILTTSSRQCGRTFHLEEGGTVEELNASLTSTQATEPRRYVSAHLGPKELLEH
jgi:hypothetical protein